MKRQEANDIVQYLLPQLAEVGITVDYCKVDVTTEKSGSLRGDVWISTSKQKDSSFEKNITSLIEAKHRNSNVGDMDWRNAMEHGAKKARGQKLAFYIVTNCVSETRFYNVNNDEEISLDGRLLNHLVPIEVLKKIQTQVTSENSDVRHKSVTLTQPFAESKFRNSLKTLADIYRSAAIKEGDARIDPTVSFVVLKYIDEYEKEKRTLDPVIKLWGDFRNIAKGSVASDLKVEFETMVNYIWNNDTYKNNNYKDFKELIKFSSNLRHEHFVKIYNELDQYNFHGANFDLFGAIYEEFASQGKKKKFGEFYTRRHITGLVARLLLRNEVNVRNLRVCDPACGTGGFLTEAFKTLVSNYSINSQLNEKVKKQLKEEIFWGFDFDFESVARTKLNMFLVGDGHVHIYKNDSLTQVAKQGWDEGVFDYILTNPPMGKYDGDADIDSFSFTNEKRYELMFVEKVINAVKHGGEIAIVLNDGALETPSRVEFRKKLLDNCDVYAIISLSKFAFAPYTKEKTYVLFMRRKQEGEIGFMQTFPIWHYILDYDGFANSDKRYRTKYHDDIVEVENIFSNAVSNIRNFISDARKYESHKNQYERKVNQREIAEGLNGYKFKYVDASEINEENYFNLLSEFHLRPFETTPITTQKFESEIQKILDQVGAVNFHKIADSIQEIHKYSLTVTPTITADIGTMFEITGGNSGLTEEFIYHNSPIDKDDEVKILSSSTMEDTEMGYISRNATFEDGRKLKIFSGETILIARNGYAGSMQYFKNETYATNDHAYVMTVKPEWKSKINMRFVAFHLQPLFFNIVSSKSDNATFNKEYAEMQSIHLPDIRVQNEIGTLLTKIDKIKAAL